jgi:hypothetical protein
MRHESVRIVSGPPARLFVDQEHEHLITAEATIVPHEPRYHYFARLYLKTAIGDEPVYGHFCGVMTVNQSVISQSVVSSSGNHTVLAFRFQNISIKTAGQFKLEVEIFKFPDHDEKSVDYVGSAISEAFEVVRA